MHKFRLIFEGLTPFILPLLAFAWYRRGRLWKFYYTMLDDVIDQSRVSSINWDKWENIAKKHTTSLSMDFFGALCQFELAYLRYQIKQARWEFWTADGSATAYLKINQDLEATHVVERERINDKEKFAETTMRKVFFKKMRFFGIWFFIKSFIYIFTKDKSTGIEKSRSEKPVRNFLNNPDKEVEGELL